MEVLVEKDLFFFPFFFPLFLSSFVFFFSWLDLSCVSPDGGAMLAPAD